MKFKIELLKPETPLEMTKIPNHRITFKNNIVKKSRLDILREFSRTERQDFSERGLLPKITNSATLNLKIKLYNVALKKVLTNKECDLSNLNAIIYAIGKAISNQMGVKTKKEEK